MYATALRTASVCCTNLNEQHMQHFATTWQLRWIKNTDKLVYTFSSNTLPKSYYINVEFNEKFDKRNCLGQWLAMCHHFCVTLKRPTVYVSYSLCRTVAKRPGR